MLLLDKWLPNQPGWRVILVLWLLSLGLLLLSGCAKKTTEPDPIIVDTPDLGEMAGFTDNITISFKFLDATGEIEKVACQFTWTADKRMTGPCAKVPPGVYVYQLEYREQGTNLLLASASAKIDIGQNNAVVILPILDFNIKEAGNNETNLTIFIGGVSPTPTPTPSNQPPQANAGADQTVKVGDEVLLDASDSSDVNGDDLSYGWRIVSAPSGNSATVVDASRAKASLTPDVEGEYVVELEVNDGLRSDVDSLRLSVTVAKPQMVAIPAGSFQMGDETSSDGVTKGSGESDEIPVHSVTIAAFEMGKYEVTVAQFRAFVDASNYVTDAEKNEGGVDGCAIWNGSSWDWTAGKSWRDPNFIQTDNDPVVCVSWNDAKAYTTWLNEQTGLTYRLLSEAEWEYAARAGTSTKYLFGDAIDHDDANYGKDSCCAGLAVAGTKDIYLNTAPVGRFSANLFGLHDMHGNVWEWVEDCWYSSYTDAPGDGSAWLEKGSSDCSRRVLRGGSWNYGPKALRSATRSRSASVDRSNYAGFRLARTF